MKAEEKIQNKLCVTKEQEDLLKKFKVCQEAISIDMIENVFIYAYSLAMKLNEEGKRIKEN